MKLFNLLATICIPFMLFANGIKQEKSKTIHRNFTVDSDAYIDINNLYGNINIITWDKNEVDFNIKITVSGSDIDAVNEKLDRISIDFENSKIEVIARTKLKSIKFLSKLFFSGISGKKNTNIKINYTVKVPKNSNLFLENKYGNIDLPVILGRSEINCYYGDIYAESLQGNTKIKLSYSRNSEIQEIKNGEIEAGYSTIEIKKATNLAINTKYSNINIKKVNNLKIDNRYTNCNIGTSNHISFNIGYDTFSVKKVKTIEGNSKYTTINFGTIEDKITLNTKYGHLRIDNFLCKNTTSEITTSYTNSKILIPQNHSISFDVSTRYTKFRYPKEKTELYKSIKNGSSGQFQGVIGNKDTKTHLIVNSEFGTNFSIDFNEDN